jgi:SAM-dependent methyltransferase
MNALSGPSDQHRYGPAPALIALIQGAALAQAICVAADLRIADLMANGCTTAGELAQSTGSHPPSLHRLLRALTSLGLCDEDPTGSFALTPMGSLLRSDTPDSLRSWLLWFGKYQCPVWGQLLHSVRTGESARTLVTGAEGFGLLQGDPEAAALFNDTMVQLTRAVAAEVAYACDFAGMRRIVDVGGGYGTLLAAILQAHPQLRGVLLDMPHAIKGAAQQFERSGLAERCELLAGDFFQRIPEGADAYILKNIIHDWDDDRSSAILDNCRRAILDHGKLLIIERVMPARMEDSSAYRAIAYADLAMLIGPGGRERTEPELQILLDHAGFALARVTATALGYSILEAVPSSAVSFKTA